MTTTINNEHKKLNVPNLRFPEFQGEWEKYELGDICDIITDFVAAGSFASLRENVKYYQENNYAQLIRTIDLKNNFTNSDFVYVDEVAYDFLWRVQLKEPNIVLPNIGANIGEKYYVKPQDLPKNKNVLGPNAILLRSKCNDTHFVYFRLSTSSYDNEMKKLVGASGQPKFNKTDLKKVSLFMPSLIEQKRIAYFLALLEERIATQNKIIDKMQSLIKGIAQKIVRSNKPNVRLYECVECSSSTQQESEVCEQGAYPVYGANGIVGYLDDYNTEGEAVYIIKDGSGVGTVSYVTGKCSATGTLNTLQAKDGYSLQYLYYLLKVFNFEPYKTGMAIPHIYFKDYGKAKVFCPSYTEQLQYARLLSAIDSKLSVEKNTLRNLSLQKQYLLRQMFI
ncbi:Type I restriction-modification system, specificity subunit S [Bacteroides ovatus]|uniref:restriction endonuclease subunit S n=1 Tax=Bacteroides ovatus TaxID=28116 RepID=UPI0020A736CB|nr:restriction endonuclease subunit S [Bacteroides ovatus]CAG9890722.1 Type I restriction-modification system, specificity subunit S [Bacteroides ovatus]